LSPRKIVLTIQQNNLALKPGTHKIRELLIAQASVIPLDTARCIALEQGLEHAHHHELDSIGDEFVVVPECV
jgi:hypothetical protein